MDPKIHELESKVKSQQEQLTRYEKRLKDVVTAYKGLLNEKEALESSLAAISGAEGRKGEVNDGKQSSSSPAKESFDPGNENNNLKTQLQTLMNSLATLSAEKSRMESLFQADKKQLLMKINQKNEAIENLKRSIEENEQKSSLAIDEMKSKWLLERQEREQETNNQLIMIRELQKLYSDEHHLKENVEMQLNSLKLQIVTDNEKSVKESTIGNKRQTTEVSNIVVLQEEEKEQDANVDIGATTLQANTLLQQLQKEMMQLKEQHAIAIKNEQRRVYLAEEESRQQAAFHEERVANLEARLAELSATVGNYDRLRQQDQQSILELKKQLELLDSGENYQQTMKGVKRFTQLKKDQGNPTKEKKSINRQEQRGVEEQKDDIKKNNGDDDADTEDISVLIDEIMYLKKILMKKMNTIAIDINTCPIDISKVFTINTDHNQCENDRKSLEKQLHDWEIENKGKLDLINQQKQHIATLQDKVQVLNSNIDEQENELKQLTEKLRSAINEERLKWQERYHDLENINRSKVNDLEQQLQKQRQRSLQLLEEKENEIKTLQTSFEIIHGGGGGSGLSVQKISYKKKNNHNVEENNEQMTRKSNKNGRGEVRFSVEDDDNVVDERIDDDDDEVERNDGENDDNNDNTAEDDINHDDNDDDNTEDANRRNSKILIKTKQLSLGDSCHMLHYANELARKDIEIANLRKSKYNAEQLMRSTIQEKVAVQEKLREQINNLEEQVDRLERCQTREGANLEYLKNVVISYITSKDTDGRRHMLNAISAVLQFTTTEQQTINQALK